MLYKRDNTGVFSPIRRCKKKDTCAPVHLHDLQSWNGCMWDSHQLKPPPGSPALTQGDHPPSFSHQFLLNLYNCEGNYKLVLLSLEQFFKYTDCLRSNHSPMLGTSLCVHLHFKDSFHLLLQRSCDPAFLSSVFFSICAL